MRWPWRKRQPAPEPEPELVRIPLTLHVNGVLTRREFIYDPAASVEAEVRVEGDQVSCVDARGNGLVLAIWP